MRSSSLLPLIAVILIAEIIGCASPEVGGARGVSFGDGESQLVSQSELQEDLQRFSSQFIERAVESFAKMGQQGDSKLEQTSMKHLLRYVSSILDIATGPYPEVNLLDMITFVRLNREVLEDYWIPKVYGQKAGNLLTALRQSEEDLIEIADKVSTKAQQQQLNEIIQSWRKKNPDQISVEWVRLADFSKKAGRLEAERAEETGGLLSNMKRAVSTADQALLLANRAMFLSQRMPFLLRLQARIGAKEILSDSIDQLGQTGDLTNSVGPLVQNMAEIMTRMETMMNRAAPLMAEFRKYFLRCW